MHALILLDSGTERGWWFCDERSYRASSIVSSYVGCKETFDYLAGVFASQGPFDGVIGFSQGASVLSVLCCMAHTDPRFKFSFAVFVSGQLCDRTNPFSPFTSDSS